MRAGPVLVCLKWVPLRPEIDPLSGAITTDPRFSGASPADWSALEWALRLTADGGDVVAASLAGPGADPMLRDALAVGASAAVRIDRDAESASSTEVAAELAVLAVDLGTPLVVSGDHSLDRGSGSVPAFVATELGWPQALGLVRAERNGVRMTVERRLDQGRRERLTVSGSAVISFEAGAPLRRASLGATMAATGDIIDVRAAVGASGLAPPPTVVGTGPYRPRTNVKPAPEGSTRDRLLNLTGSQGGEVSARIFEGSPDEAAAVAHGQLMEWGYLERPENGLDPPAEQ